MRSVERRSPCPSSTQPLPLSLFCFCTLCSLHTWLCEVQKSARCPFGIPTYPALKPRCVVSNTLFSAGELLVMFESECRVRSVHCTKSASKQGKHPHECSHLNDPGCWMCHLGCSSLPVGTGRDFAQSQCHCARALD